MNKIFHEYLFNKSILIADSSINEENKFECLFSLAHFYGIRIISGQELVNFNMISLCGSILGNNPPTPFYEGFPKTVKKLTQKEAIYDQALNYFLTYGLGVFDENRKSIFEKDFDRIAFKEDVTIKEFQIITEDEAVKMLRDIVDNLCLSSRPLSNTDYALVLRYVNDFKYIVKECNCKDTLCLLILHSTNTDLAKLLKLSDTIRFVELIANIKEQPLNKLNIPNYYRKLITKVLDTIFEEGYVNTIDCFEKQKTWVGLLHNIHYVPKNDIATSFVNEMRNSKNKSIYSSFERYMAEGNIVNAVNYLIDNKGTGSLLRNLDYILSRCKTDSELEFVMGKIDSKNNIILIQLLYKYYFYNFSKDPRIFKYVVFNKLRTYTESSKEVINRKSLLSKEITDKLLKIITSILEKNLKGSLGKVYISKEMYDYAVPLQNQTSNAGFGILPTGSKIKIKRNNKIRSFIYWEKVNDIDLSLFILYENKDIEEVSWRNINSDNKKRKTFIFSGDCVDGIEGGSEYFDIDFKLVKSNYKKASYLILCANVYSGYPFMDCICKAGYMTRKKKDTGEIYEPKTVKSAFNVSNDSTYALLYAIDLNTKELIWLNIGIDSYDIVAANYENSFVNNYLELTKVFSIGKLFEYLATSIVKSIEEADVIVSDEVVKNNTESLIIKSSDIDKILALLNK